MKCENCKKEKHIVDIQNYSITFEQTNSYNCCCKDCALECAKSDGIRNDEIVRVEE